MLNLVSKEHRKPEGIVVTSTQVIERWGAATEKHPMLSLCWMLFPDSQSVKHPIMHKKEVVCQYVARLPPQSACIPLSSLPPNHACKSSEESTRDK
jgi:hypothetical protein